MTIQHLHTTNNTVLIDSQWPCSSSFKQCNAFEGPLALKVTYLIEFTKKFHGIME